MPSQHQLSWLPLFIMILLGMSHLWDDPLRWRQAALSTWPPREGVFVFMGNESFAELSGLG